LRRFSSASLRRYARSALSPITYSRQLLAGSWKRCRPNLGSWSGTRARSLPTTFIRRRLCQQPCGPISRCLAILVNTLNTPRLSDQSGS
jgi:hypothetical protein